MAVKFKGAPAPTPTPATPSVPVPAPSDAPDPTEARKIAIADLMTLSGLPFYQCSNLLYPAEKKYLVKTVQDVLLTKEQKVWMMQQNMDVAAILEGAWTHLEQVRVEQMFADWNKRLGKVVFRTSDYV